MTVFRISFPNGGNTQYYAHYKTGTQPNGWTYTTYNTISEVRAVYDGSPQEARFGTPSYQELENTDINGNSINN